MHEGDAALKWLGQLGRRFDNLECDIRKIDRNQNRFHCFQLRRPFDNSPQPKVNKVRAIVKGESRSEKPEFRSQELGRDESRAELSRRSSRLDFSNFIAK